MKNPTSSTAPSTPAPTISAPTTPAPSISAPSTPGPSTGPSTPSTPSTPVEYDPFREELLKREEMERKKSIKNWQIEDVSSWLKEHGFESYIDSFKKNKIDGEAFLKLEAISLKELGVELVGDRLKY